MSLIETKEVKFYSSVDDFPQVGNELCVADGMIYAVSGGVKGNAGILPVATVADLPPASEFFGVARVTDSNTLYVSNGVEYERFNTVNKSTESELARTDSLRSVDYYDYNIVCIDDNYLYGHKSGFNRSALFRVPKSLNSYEASLLNTPVYTCPTNLSFKLISITSVPGELYAVIGSEIVSPQVFSLYRSTDYGETFTEVAKLGETSPGVQIEQVSNETSSGFCEAFINGTRKLFLAEYNINDSRVEGGTNDQLRILSSQNGINWSPVVTYNTAGSRIVRHFHDIALNPYNGLLYVTMGDSENEPAIVIWDGIAEWPDNIEHTALALLPGFKVLTAPYGPSQSWRATELVFTDTHCYWTCDANPGYIEHGIYRFPNTFDANSSIEKVNNSLGVGTEMIGWKGGVINGRPVLTNYLRNTGISSDKQIEFYTANPDGTVWKSAGVVQLASDFTGAAIAEFTVDGDKMYCSFGLNSLAGKAGRGTVVIELRSNDFVDSAPHQLYPNYFVAAAGVNDTTAGRGWYPDRPWASPLYALASNRVTNGSVISVADSISEVGGVVLFNAHATRPGVAGKGVTVRGVSAGETLLSITNAAIGYNFTTDNHNVIFQDITLNSSNLTATQPLAQITLNNTSVKLIDAVFDFSNKEVAGSAVVGNAGNIKLIRSDLIGTPMSQTSSYNGINMTAIPGATVTLLQGSTIQGFRRGIACNARGFVKLFNSAILNYGNIGIYQCGSPIESLNSIIFSKQPLIVTTSIELGTELDLSNVKYTQVHTGSYTGIDTTSYISEMPPFSSIYEGNFKMISALVGGTPDSISKFGRNRQLFSNEVGIIGSVQ